MGTHPQIIGRDMRHGWAGNYARQPDSVVVTRPAGGDSPITFGTPLEYDGNGNVIAMGASATAAQFVGVAISEIKSSLSFLTQGAGQYAPGEAVGVLQRGSIHVYCQRGTPALGGAVYVRIAANSSYSSAVVGGFEAEADSSNSVQLTNCQWGGPADAEGVAELVVRVRENA